MPRLIVINGPPGCGKSTLARMYADEHRFALNLDIDRIRGMIGQWRQEPGAAGLLARAVTLAAADTHLRAGYDVVIPQLLARPEFLLQVEDLARRVGARFHEVVLLDSKENMLRRVAERTRTSTDPVDQQNQWLLDRTGGTEALTFMYDALLSLVATRPAATVVHSRHGAPDETYTALLAALDDGAGS